EWAKFCHSNGSKISRSHKGGSTDNDHIERFWRTLKFEGFYLSFPKTMVELKSMLSSFIHWYNEERLHSFLRYKTPMEVLKLVLGRETRDTVLTVNPFFSNLCNF